ncbi:hypothetical protein ACKKBG_A28980 [Auxenochlorella protothecoides x Auxenochlorella symbiontica]
MLPTTVPGPAGRRGGLGRSRVSQYIWIYLRRFFKPSQMDFQYTGWTMLQLLISPKTAYRHTSYHRQTKDHWARDDPAFVVLLAGIIALITAAYCIAFGPGLGGSLLIILAAVIRDFLIVGALVSLGGWLLATRFLYSPSGQEHAIEQRMELMYAFDVHCNSLLPWLLIVNVLQLVLSPLLVSQSYLAAAVSCTLYVAGASSYLYITFLGYSVLPGLNHTVLLLLPVGAMAVALPLAILGRFNPTRTALWLYYGYGRA